MAFFELTFSSHRSHHHLTKPCSSQLSALSSQLSALSSLCSIQHNADWRIVPCPALDTHLTACHSNRLSRGSPSPSSPPSPSTAPSTNPPSTASSPTCAPSKLPECPTCLTQLSLCAPTGQASPSSTDWLCSSLPSSGPWSVALTRASVYRRCTSWARAMRFGCCWLWRRSGLGIRGERSRSSRFGDC